ncbi:MAG: PEGA domain-containing protein [Planctomycetes bacterium]|nr:PEGA domain-containing protein [Planctomycetota bacterium]
MKSSAILMVGAALLLGGCLERRVSITSEPPGALVTANDVELGRTPLEADFTYYGTYDVRVEKEGYEPLRTKAKAQSPIYEYPPIDLVATAIPANIEKVTTWHFKLEPRSTDQAGMEAGALERAKALREQVR